MGKYIKSFDEHSDYIDYITGNVDIIPNVSSCVGERHVHYNPGWRKISGYTFDSFAEIEGYPQWDALDISSMATIVSAVVQDNRIIISISGSGEASFTVCDKNDNYAMGFSNEYFFNFVVVPLKLNNNEAYMPNPIGLLDLNRVGRLKENTSTDPDLINALKERLADILYRRRFIQSEAEISAVTINKVYLMDVDYVESTGASLRKTLVENGCSGSSLNTFDTIIEGLKMYLQTESAEKNYFISMSASYDVTINGVNYIINNPVELGM